jgi:alpha-galactosidase
MRKYPLLFVLHLFSLALFSQSQAPITLQTKNTSLVLTVGSNHRLYQSYLGPRLVSAADVEKLSGGRELYLTAGMENQFEPAIRLVHDDGNPSL